MTQSSGRFILRAIRVAYATSAGLALLGAVGGWYYWPGFLAWLCLFLAAVALAGGIALAQLLSRIRMILWLLPFAERLQAALRLGGRLIMKGVSDVLDQDRR